MVCQAGVRGVRGWKVVLVAVMGAGWEVEG